MRPLLLGHDANRRSLRLRAEDRKVHTHIVGSSGSGKSKFMESIMRGDLMNGQGFTLVDPHGTLYDEMVEYCAHRALGRNVILLNLSEPDSVVGFNPFQRAPEGDISVQVDRRVTATMHAWNVKDTDQTPTLARTLRLIYTVMLEQDLGLPQVQHLIDFNSKSIRAQIIERLSSPLIQKEWRELQALQHREWREETLSARNRLFKFLTSKALSRFMGVPGHGINLQEVMDQGKVLLVRLGPSDYLSADNAKAFGALLVNEFFECARRRKRGSSGEPPKPHYLLLDEFASFVSLDISDMLDQVRKFGLFLVLAHQRFGQIEADLVDAVLTNCGIKAVFGGLSTPDARRIAEELFIGDLDAKKIKLAIEQTKFWPEYSRDKVYSKGRSHTATSANTTSSGRGNFGGSSAGSFFQPTEWFGIHGEGLAGTSESLSFGRSHMSGNSQSSADAYGETESEADIPIYRPVPFKELSSVHYYTHEEQLTELAAALKEQLPRHCFIKIGSQAAQPMLVPLIEQRFTPAANRQWYFEKVGQEQHALSGDAVDALIEEQELNLLRSAALDRTPVERQEKVLSNKRTRVESATHDPLNKILEGFLGRE